MDKKGSPFSIKFPRGLELMTRQIAKQEGRGVSEMVAHLLARGIHSTLYDAAKYLNTGKDGEEIKSESPHIRRTISLATRFEVFKRDGFTCQYCGQKPPAVNLELDHIIPVAKGGTNKIENLKTSCYQCNRGKADK